MRKLRESYELPVAPLSESEIMFAAQKIAEGKKGSQIVLGNFSPEKVSANFNGGKVNKVTGELYPEVHAIKCVEQQVSTGTAYANHQVVKDRNSSDAWIQKQAERQQQIDAGEAVAKGPAIPQWIIPNIIGVNSAGNKVLTYWPNLQNRPRVKYYISIDGEPYRECSKEEIAQYKSPADAQNFLTPYADKQADKVGDTPEIVFRTALLSRIYKLDSVGNTFMMKSSTNDEINRMGGEQRFVCTVLSDGVVADEQSFVEESAADAFIFDKLKAGDSVIKNDKVRKEKHQYDGSIYTTSIMDLAEVEVPVRG